MTAEPDSYLPGASKGVLSCSHDGTVQATYLLVSDAIKFEYDGVTYDSSSAMPTCTCGHLLLMHPSFRLEALN